MVSNGKNPEPERRPGDGLKEKSPSSPSIGTWLVVLVVLAFAYQLFFGPSGVKSGKLAPSIQLQQLDNARKWTPKWQKKVSVLEFWASHCSICVSKLRSSSARAARNQRDGIQHLMINIDAPTNVPTLQRYLKSQGIPKKQWYVHQRDDKYQGTHGYRIRALPTIVLIDRKGKVAQYFQGALSDSFLRAYIDKIGKTSSLSPPKPRLRALALTPWWDLGSGGPDPERL